MHAGTASVENAVGSASQVCRRYYDDKLAHAKDQRIAFRFEVQIAHGGAPFVAAFADGLAQQSIVKRLVVMPR